MANAAKRSNSVSQPGKEFNHTSKSPHFVAMVKRFQDMRSNMELCDATLKVENVIFAAHRVVLAGNSPYLKNIFLAQNTEGRCQEVILPNDVESKTVKLMLDYFYSGKMSGEEGVCYKMMSLAYLFQVDEIIEMLQEFILEILHPSNCLKFQSLARNLKLTVLQSKIDRFVDWNFMVLLKEPAFLSLSGEHLVHVIRSENLRVKREETVYEAVYRWFKYDINGRESIAKSIFKEIRFHDMPSKYLTDKVIPVLCDKHDICVQQVREALEHIQTADENAHASTSYCSRKPEDILYVISNRTNLVERYDSVKCACAKSKELSAAGPVEHLGENRYVVAVGQDLYAVSNCRVAKFNVLELSWEDVGVGVDVHDSGVCAGKNCIFVAGGRRRGNGVRRLNIESFEWVDMPEMNSGRRSPGAAYLSGKLYVIGGHSPDGPLASVERFEAKQEKWVILKPMNFPRFLLGACAVQGLVYAVGGRNNEQSLDSVEVYDPRTKTWALLETKMMESRNDFGLAAKGSQIFCVGGRGVKSIECLDVQTKEWKTVGSTGENNFSISCVFYPPL